MSSQGVGHHFGVCVASFLFSVRLHVLHVAVLPISPWPPLSHLLLELYCRRNGDH